MVALWIAKLAIANAWQFSKVYPELPESTQYYSPYDRTVIWEWPTETHLDENRELTPEYWAWRDAGMTHDQAVRYPAGMKHRHECAFSLLINQDGSEERLNYIQARKRLYIPWYVHSVRRLPQFRELKARVKAGENLLIVEVDGPHQESLAHYQDKYDVDDDFIEGGTMLATLDNLSIMLNDSKHAFGHGYCLAAALLGIDRELRQL